MVFKTLTGDRQPDRAWPYPGSDQHPVPRRQLLQLQQHRPGGNAGFNEIFPLFSWYVVESDSTRFKNTGTHVIYDKGGPADGTCSSTTAPCGPSTTNEAFLANTAEENSVPAALRVPGARYCANPDCPAGDSAGGSTGRVDPAWVTSEGWQGFSARTVHRLRQDTLRTGRDWRDPWRSDLRLNAAIRRS